MNTPADVIAKLATLGEPRQIADHLLAQGIRGNHRAGTCPVARYVHQETGTRVGVGSPFWLDGDTSHRIPIELARFIHAYDFGYFPELEAETAE